MGSADLVPGVSGGTIAFISGIYERLIASIKTVSGPVLKFLIQGKVFQAWQVVPVRFLLPLGIGLATAVITLSSLLSHLLRYHPVYVWSFFFGLVLASIWVVGKRVERWRLRYVVIGGLAAVVAYFLVNAMPVETPSTLSLFFLSGAIAITAMILPGISGSFLLVIMGKYEQVLWAVTQRDAVVVGTVLAGAALGLALFSRVLSWLFKHHHDMTIVLLTGFMVGSLRKIWPWKEALVTRMSSRGFEVPVYEVNVLPPTLDSGVALALLLILFGALLVLILDRLRAVDQVEPEAIDSKSS